MNFPEKPAGCLRIFSGGDVFGETGLHCILALLPGLIRSAGIDFCVVNGENTDSGSGITREQAEKLFAAGVDVITGGNHSFEKRALWHVLDEFENILRPGNFPAPESELVAKWIARLSAAEEESGASNPDTDNAIIIEESSPANEDAADAETRADRESGASESCRLPGRGFVVAEKEIGGVLRRICVVNVQGRESMRPLDCPFRYTENVLASLGGGATRIPVVVDFHGESNAEKEAFSLYYKGRVSAVTGTHTHVQTADARILPGGTAYITDLGMTGVIRSVIGSEPADAVRRAVSQVPLKMREARGEAALRGCIIDIDAESAEAVSVVTVEEKYLADSSASR